MITGGEAALIGAAGVVVGAVITGIIQILASRIERKQQREEGKREQKRAVYETYLLHVANLPANWWEAVVQSDQARFARDFADALAHLRVGIALDASPEVADQMRKLQDKVWEWFGSFPADAPAGQSAPGIINRSFDELVLPQLTETGNAMASELGSQ
jgi:hypothetical protein